MQGFGPGRSHPGTHGGCPSVRMEGVHRALNKMGNSGHWQSLFVLLTGPNVPSLETTPSTGTSTARPHPTAAFPPGPSLPPPVTVCCLRQRMPAHPHPALWTQVSIWLCQQPWALSTPSSLPEVIFSLDTFISLKTLITSLEILALGLHSKLISEQLRVVTSTAVTKLVSGFYRLQGGLLTPLEKSSVLQVSFQRVTLIKGPGS